ncbi:KH homology domain-containing protein 4 isoform X2 [Chanos chanos]|uniref:KH homology domain-containing protein 4 n=1 Tax=Chanos chanos TaxID=29144 RepID=A0A6J2UPK5_CHACN|nr:KH homology domain-containing protein 4-like isoform X2 [Chanos chanos]
MASGTPCLNSRWDQPKSKTDILQSFAGNVSHTLSSHITSAPDKTVLASPHFSAASTAVASSQQPRAAQTAGAAQTSAEDKAPQGGVEMAAAMAAKINAMLMAKGKLKPLQPLPPKIPPCTPVTSSSSSSEELVVTEVDINDVPINCRNLLTKGKTQEEIRQHSGAVVSTKGLYMTTAEKSSIKGVERPLYLHVQGRGQEQVNKAVQRIKEIISEEVLRSSGGQQPPVMPTLPVYPQPPRPAVPAQPLRPQVPNSLHPGSTGPPSQRPAGPHGHSGNFVHTKIFVGLDQAMPSFNVKEKVEGPSGSYLQHIQSETGARVFLRGKGSGYIEQASRRESFEPLYLYISHPNSTGLDAAKKLCESLLETVRAEHARMLSTYTATGSTQGYPANSNYSSQRSWYSYPSNGYTGGYSAYPGASNYWTSVNGHSNMSTTPPSSQPMVQYPVCPRKPPPYLVEEQDAEDAGVNGLSTSPPSSTSPKRHFLEECDKAEEKEADGCADAHTNEEEPAAPASDTDEGKCTERMLMPPPPLPLTATATATARKRGREDVEKEEAPVMAGKAPPESVKKPKLPEDSLGLVPYGGDSSDEEEDRSRSCKKT